MSAFIVIPEPMFNRLIMSEWLNADEREINEATEIWQKHRNIKSVGKSTENVGVLQEPIEETMKKLRKFSRSFTFYQDTFESIFSLCFKKTVR